jgi:hypothetical protein
MTHPTSIGSKALTDPRDLRQALSCVLGADADALLLQPHAVLNPTPAVDGSASDPGPAFLEALNRQGREAPLEALRLSGPAPAEETEGQPPLPARPVTLVVFPGVFGEFIDDRAFGGVFAADSALRREWWRMLHSASATDRQDASYDLMRLDNVQRTAPTARPPCA